MECHVDPYICPFHDDDHHLLGNSGMNPGHMDFVIG